MKKYLFITITLFTITSAYSQTDSTKTNNSQTAKGKKFIGGMLNNLTWKHTSTSNGNINQLGLQIVPDFGYFIKDDFAIGANLNIGIYNTHSNNLDINSTSYGIGGFARYYKKITDKFLFFANAGVSYAYGTGRWGSSNINEQVRSNTLSFAISPGLVYFISPKFGLEASFGNLHYTHTSSENITLAQKRQSSDFGPSFNLATFFFGLNYYF